jgi:ESCRT-I complex subunit TSG101
MHVQHQNRYPPSGVGPQAQQLSPQQAQLYTKLQAALLEFNTASSREMDNLVTVNKQLNDAESRTKAEIQSLRDLHVRPCFVLVVMAILKDESALPD